MSVKILSEIFLLFWFMVVSWDVFVWFNVGY